MSNGKIAVITGSTGGIGNAIADQLAGEGWDLVLINRNAQKAEHRKAALATANPEATIDLSEADLLDVAQFQSAATEILARHPKIDALYDNSGVLTSKRIISAQGHETHYAVNTLAFYVMIETLRPALARPEGTEKTMIINTTSAAPNSAKTLDVETLSDPAEIGRLLGAYATSKLALTTMGVAMAPELEKEGILLRSVCPGFVDTPMSRTSDSMPGFLKFLEPFFFNKPDKQARKMITAANPESWGRRTGIYLTNRKEKPLPKLATDPAVQSSLMKKLNQDATPIAP